MDKERKIALTQKQQRAFASFDRAYRVCKATGIEFYSVLGVITALNGTYLVRIHDEDNGDLPLCSISSVDNPSISDAGFSSWADDKHFAEIL